MTVKVFRRFLAAALSMALVCGLQWASSDRASAAAPSQADVTRTAQIVRPADVTCPASGSACLYQNANFLSDQDATGVDQSFQGMKIDNTMTSIRNRSNCPVWLYDTYTFSGSHITIPAHTEVANIGTTFGVFWNDRVSSILFYCI